MTGLPESGSSVVSTAMPQPTPQYEHAVRVTAMRPMVGGQCFRLFSGDVIGVKIDAHRARSHPVSVVSPAQLAGTAPLRGRFLHPRRLWRSGSGGTRPR